MNYLSVTMKGIMMLTAFFLRALVVVSSHECGPSNSCTCTETSDSNREINCTDSKSILSVVCDYVGTQANITRLIFSRNAFSAINATDLNGCEELTSLDIQNCHLSIIQDNAFERLQKLRVLKLSQNNLSSLYTKNVTCRFTYLTNLTALYIDRNVEQDIKDGQYPNLTCLASLTILHMDSVSGSKFGPEFERLQSLHAVSLSGFNGFCNLQRVKRSSFEGLLYVRNLNISKCNVTGFEADALQYLRYLEVLDISFNQHVGFSILPNVSFGLQFTNIKVLNASKMFPTFGIGTTLEKRHICYLWNTSLKELDLSSNRIQLIETNAPILLSKSLQTCHMNDNIFTYGSYLLQLACADKLREVYLNRGFSSHPLINQYIGDDTATYYGNDGAGCPFMEDAFLENESRNISKCQFMDSKTDTIDFGVPGTLRKMEYSSCRLEYKLVKLTPTNILEYVDISGNIFDAWEGPVNLSYATYLDLSNNFCSYINPGFFTYMGNLQNLQVQRNFLGLVLNKSSSHLEFFNGLDSLKTINMSSNRIRSLPKGLFNQLGSIERIDLSKNSLQELDIEFESLKNLWYLDVSFNALPYLPSDLLHHLSEVSKRRNIRFKLDLSENILLLSCKDIDFLNFLLTYKNNFNNFDNYLFEDENRKQKYGYELQETVKSLNASCHNYTYIIVACCAGILIFIIVVIIGLIYKHRWKLRFLFHMAKRRYFKHEQVLLEDGHDDESDDIDANLKYDVFVSYAEEDIQFVRRGIIPQLEENGLRLCIHQRDFIAGKAISDNIVDSIHDSRKTVAILSANYVRRQWCMYEFHMARMQNIYHRNNSLIIVMLEQVHAGLMPLEMVAWLDTESYLEYTTDADGQVLFWERLKANIQVRD